MVESPAARRGDSGGGMGNGVRERSRIVLMAAEGMSNKEIAAEPGMDSNKVGRWRTRYAKEGPRAIKKERPRGANHGGKDTRAQAALRARVIEATTQTASGRDALGVPGLCGTYRSAKSW